VDFDDAFTASSLKGVDDFVFSFGEVATEPLAEVVCVVGVRWVCVAVATEYVCLHRKMFF
jgi:hypothetical protein